jgi:thiamine biosynthesis lipoprotein
MKNRSLLIFISALLCVSAIVFAAVYAACCSEKQSTFWVMDTISTVKVKGPGARAAAEKAEEITRNLDSSLLSRHSESSLTYRINKNAGGKVPAEYAKYIQTMLEVYEKSSGAFDFTLGNVSDLWGIGTDNERVPSDEELKEALSSAGADKIKVGDGEISFPEGVAVDFGASGKGIALDEISNSFKDCKINRAVVSVGGSVMLYGKGDFTVGIKNPGGEGYMAVLNLGSSFVSTSGSYERYFEKDGVRYHHILDPETGRPVSNGLVSVTIISGSGALSDALSTACFVLGTEKGMELCRAFGCEGVFIDGGGTVYVTDGAAGMLEITDSGYHLEGR